MINRGKGVKVFCIKCSEPFFRGGKHNKICEKCWKRAMTKNGKKVGKLGRIRPKDI